jgi:large subunit ribosomal protein L32
MAVPKRKTSKARTRRRKATWKRRVTSPTLVECSHCHEMKRAHTICPSCGYYKDKQVLNIKVKGDNNSQEE